MSSTTFTNGVTLTDADWFNDVNRLHYTIFGDPTATINAYDALKKRGSSVASAATLDLTGVTGDFVHITGSTGPITAVTLSDGDERVVIFDSTPTLTHGASLLLPGGSNITAAANDVAIFRGDASNVVYCICYMKASGQPLSAFLDSSAVVKGSSDSTKQIRFEVDGLTTATTRVLTVQDADQTLVGRDTTDTLTNKTLTAPALNGALSGDAIAVQSEMETATATDSIVAPGNMKYHPCMPKAWAVFDGSVVGTNAPTAGSGITSITRNGAGDYTVNFSITWSAANYAMVGTCVSSGGTKLYCVNRVPGGTYTTTAFQLGVYAVSDITSNAATDATWISIAFWGDL